MIIAYNTLEDPGPGSGGEPSEGANEGTENQGTIILDATCAPQNISYPRDVNLLNEARESMESLIDRICYDYGYYKPRMYRRNARRDYLNLAKCKKRTAKKIRKAVKQQLQYIRRDMGYVETFVSGGVELTPKQAARLSVVHQVYEQQQYMYENNTHTVKDRIVSISQPYIRLIVRGKAAAPVEFGAKLDTTTRGSIALSILAMNVDRLVSLSLLRYLILLFSRYKQHGSMLTYMQNSCHGILAG